MAVILGVPGAWIRDLDTGIDYTKVVHGSQELQLFRSLPASGTVIGKTSVVEVVDKGKDRGAILISRRDLYDKITGEHLATATQSTFCRADGGFGGPAVTSPTPHHLPERPSDFTVNLATSPQMALLYRLNGDYNPLHAVPEVARRAGFSRPILHGLASFGLAGWTIVRDVCEGRPERLKQLACRFSAPVVPGERLCAELWRDGAVIGFKLKAMERDVVVVDNGRAELTSV
jgi:acyl dehydratase